MKNENYFSKRKTKTKNRCAYNYYNYSAVEIYYIIRWTSVANENENDKTSDR